MSKYLIKSKLLSNGVYTLKKQWESSEPKKTALTRQTAVQTAIQIVLEEKAQKIGQVYE